MLKFSRSLTRTTALAAVMGVLALSAAHAAPFDQAPASSGPPNSSVILDSSGRIINKTPDTSSSYSASYTTAAPEKSKSASPRRYKANADGQKAEHRKFSPEKMQEHVENRIKTLHEKLKIMPQQEPAWSDVAQAMRDSEANVSLLIQERHKNMDANNAVEDLESYQRVVQAHADGLKKVIANFKPLYDEMSPEQKKNADDVFNNYKVGRGMHKAKHTGSKQQ
ncbi:MAG: Spy/CpxP family protein refolding chaperone [Alphaproteobacteria bacterium]